MNNLKTVIVVGWFVTGLTSCEEWLDVSTTTQLDRNDLFQTESGYSEALTGVYAKMCDESLYGRTLTFDVVDIMAGYYKNLSGDHNRWYLYDYGDETNQDAVEYCATYMETVWTNLYSQIANLNSLLETIDKNQHVFSNDNYHLIKGEALGLRAYLHFDLLRLFAKAYSIGRNETAIPYVTELTPLVTPLSIQDSIVSLILKDLESAKTLMTNDPMRLGITPDACLASVPSGTYVVNDNIETWHNRRFRFNYYAVVATMARVYLWKGDRANALIMAKEIIAEQETKFPWVSSQNLSNIGQTGSESYRNQDRSFATEHIFALNVTDLEDCMDTYLLNGEIGITFNSENSLEIYPDERLDVYEGYTADFRYQYWFQGYQSNFLLAKFYQNSVTARYFQERLPLIRISEMYYIAAECSDNTTDGLSYLETVRSHRGLSSFALPPSANLDEEILKEYRKEFWGEGQLWYYYKRKSYTEFNRYMTDLNLFTWTIPDIEIANAGRE